MYETYDNKKITFTPNLSEFEFTNDEFEFLVKDYEFTGFQMEYIYGDDICMTKACLALYGISGTADIDGSNQADFEAGENLAISDAVCIKPNDAFYDSMESYANTTAIQAVYVDSDASNKMVSLEETNFAIGSKALKITSAGAANASDLAIRTISNRNLTGYSIVMLIRGSAETTNFQFRIGSTAGLASNYRYGNIVVVGANTYQIVTIAVADMTESGTCDETAITQAGFFHSGSGAETIIVDRMWFLKAGTTKYRLYKADATNWSLLPAIGFVNEAYFTGDIVESIITRDLLDGFNGLVPGADVYLSETAGGIVQFKASLPTLKQKLGTAVSPTTIKVDIGLVA
jgi:hypothetical protein